MNKPKPSKERFCPSCGEGKVEDIKGTEPYSEDYLMCNKCGQEMLDSGHRCAVPKANASSQLGDGRGAVDFVCPHCKDKEAWASRVQSSDDLSWKWRDMSSMSRQERDTILHKAAEAAMIDYEGGSDLMSFTINGDIFDATRNHKHHFEDMLDGTLWCRMCGLFIDNKNIVDQIINDRSEFKIPEWCPLKDKK